MVAEPYDALVIGGGHNGLVCACYLAAAGQRVRILERRGVVGGAAVTEEFHPGFRNSVASYTVSLLHPQIIQDLKLHQHGLQLIKRPLANFLPLPTGGHFSLHSDRDALREEISRFSKHDAARIGAYLDMLAGVGDLIRSLMLEPPPNLKGGLNDLFQGLKMGRHLKGLNTEQRRDLWNFLTRSAGEILDNWFETDVLKAALGFDSVVGNFVSPYTPGSAYVLLHHEIGELNGERGVWGHAIGGMGAITQAMAKQAQALGVDIRLNATVQQVMVEGDQATGVILDSGEAIYARQVVANVNPKLLYLNLLPEGQLQPAIRQQMQSWRCGSASFRMNVALSELPSFNVLPGSECQPHHQAGIIIAPSLAYMDRAYLDARLHGYSRSPVVELLIPSTLDDSLAPPGQHVASLFCQHFSPELPGGRSWDEVREAAADHIINIVNQMAPNFRRSILGRQILSPLDLEREFGLLAGDIFHGAMGLDQIYSARPLVGYADYRTPVGGLYLCGAGAHPGGGVSGLPGHNAAQEILRDWKRR